MNYLGFLALFLKHVPFIISENIIVYLTSGLFNIYIMLTTSCVFSLPIEGK